MYGDPERIAEGCLEGYLDSLKVPGTVPHILAVLRGWFSDMTRLEALLPGIAEMPTMLVWGDRDCAVDPASAKELGRILRRSELRVVAGGGHIVFEELPEEANRLLGEWIRRRAADADQGETTLQPRPAHSVTQPGPALIQHLSHGT
jgi:pimeloyl-ACP methyl ester carboxylesterase